MKRFIVQILKKIANALSLERVVVFLFFYYWRHNSLKFYKTRNHHNKPRLLWGPTPVINNKYWSEALKQKGYHSKTLMRSYYNINKKEDYDYYYNDIEYTGIKFFIKKFECIFPNIYLFLLLDYIIKNYDIIHIPCTGGILCNTNYWKEEIKILQQAGCLVVVLPYGDDCHRYSKITDYSYTYGLLSNYPQAAKNENKITEKVDFMIQKADFFCCGFSLDGIGRWDSLPFNYVSINCEIWNSKSEYNPNDGKSGVVKIIHTPNHRAVKGTEFIIKAVEELKSEGLKVELLLLERISNDEVKRIMVEEADILVEQVILSGYGLSGIEGMVCGLPVLSNLSQESRTRVFRRYSYLNECPILSTTPENIKENLRILITNPQLRKELGIAGRKYAEKYHSEKTAQYMFGKIYDKIWYGKEVDLMNMFHPLHPDSYNNQSPKIEHPLIENKLPEYYQRNNETGKQLFSS